MTTRHEAIESAARAWADAHAAYDAVSEEALEGGGGNIAKLTALGAGCDAADTALRAALALPVAASATAPDESLCAEVLTNFQRWADEAAEEGVSTVTLHVDNLRNVVRALARPALALPAATGGERAAGDEMRVWARKVIAASWAWAGDAVPPTERDVAGILGSSAVGPPPSPSPDAVRRVAEAVRDAFVEAAETRALENAERATQAQHFEHRARFEAEAFGRNQEAAYMKIADLDLVIARAMGGES